MTQLSKTGGGALFPKKKFTYGFGFRIGSIRIIRDSQWIDQKLKAFVVESIKLFNEIAKLLNRKYPNMITGAVLQWRHALMRVGGEGVSANGEWICQGFGKLWILMTSGG